MGSLVATKRDNRARSIVLEMLDLDNVSQGGYNVQGSPHAGRPCASS